jgi:predicted metal-dependent HD superfamily phosphohydrolase
MSMNADLMRWWRADVGTGRTAVALLESLLSRYRETHRRYHGERHVERVRRDVGVLLTDPSVSVGVIDPVAVRLAAWYHDAIYDPTSPANEANSAALAERDLALIGIDPERIERVSSLVLATTHHKPTSADEAVLLDADLAVLGADPAAYAAYVNGVRFEYRHVADTDWRVGRAAVLRSFLDRDRVFHTAPMQAFNGTARANLTAELSSLVAEQPNE